MIPDAVAAMAKAVHFHCLRLCAVAAPMPRRFPLLPPLSRPLTPLLSQPLAPLLCVTARQGDAPQMLA